MDAVKFLQERNRMYESGAATPSIGLEDDYNPVNAVKIVEGWSAAHPRKTRQSVFLEQYPEANIDENGVLLVSPCMISASHRNAHGDCANMDIDCADCRKEYWMNEVE